MSVPPVLKAVRSRHHFPLYPPAIRLIAHTEKRSYMFESLYTGGVKTASGTIY